MMEVPCKHYPLKIPLLSDKGTTSRVQTVLPESQDLILVLTVLYVPDLFDCGYLDAAYRGTLLIRNRALLGPYSRIPPMTLW